MDKKNYKKLKKILKNQDYFSNTLAEYRKMRYYNIEECDKLYMTFNTLKKIKSKNYPKSFKDRAISEYHKFRSQGIEVSDHFLSRFLNDKRNILDLSLNDILKLKEKSIKYKELVTKKGIYDLVRYEKLEDVYIRLITNNDDTELISIIFDKSDKSNKNKNNSKGEVYK